MSRPSKIIFLFTSALLILLANQAEVWTATFGYAAAVFYGGVSLVAWIQEAYDSRSE